MPPRIEAHVRTLEFRSAADFLRKFNYGDSAFNWATPSGRPVIKRARTEASELGRPRWIKCTVTVISIYRQSECGNGLTAQPPEKNVYFTLLGFEPLQGRCLGLNPSQAFRANDSPHGQSAASTLNVIFYAIRILASAVRVKH